ncbi:ubiquitin-like autophagy protein Apg12-domain-containing protein [Halteromyces radiatus]|uniref:ubiquitin-like autophagy protein Apg12-domain-containing protein n=1 Tax=Halteromyces radiatus TaxID=101107 RepID=UPI002220E8A2|nr:ubiquitin-like autophagy protein Apg12-domain-containing protein [Halteromyces radiatus]KAI8083131.1 ubiquitin-like autophagy protein Apg12-domain-containing protein [Halteromyces radiatus]
MAEASPSSATISSPTSSNDNASMEQTDDQPPFGSQTNSGQTLDSVVATLKIKDTSKVIVRFAAIGNAPILKQSYYKITASNKFQTVIQFLRKELKYHGSDPLFLYINSAFSPSPDETVSNLYKCFGTGGHLIINYCTTAAWG